MLKELQIRDFALIEHLQLTFQNGFSVLTGETGAGKSIIIDALGLLLGARASTEMIRTGCETAIVEGSFSCSEAAAQMLVDWGFAAETGGDAAADVIIAREVNDAGRSRCRVNGRMVSVGQLAELGPLLVDILGQHHQQALLNSQHHIHVLDSFGDQAFRQLKVTMESIHHRYTTAKRQLESLHSDERERLRRMDLLQFQIQEITDAAFHDGEEEQLIAEEKGLANADRITQTLLQSYGAMQEGHESQSSVLEMLSQVTAELGALTSFEGQLAQVADAFQSCLVHLEEITRDLRLLSEQYESNPERLNEVEERLRLLHDLKRKYGDTVAEINAYGEQCQEELDLLEGKTRTMQHLESQLTEAHSQWQNMAQQLSQARCQLAQSLEERVEEELSHLNMSKTSFRVQLESLPDRMTAGGMDQVEFMIAPNVGEALKPLSRIASGGELSRIMLALKAILAAQDAVPTLVFDEVDTGIGGRTAHNVASKLQTLSQHFQVLCITHLPVIAGRAHHQYSITKTTDGQRTTVQVQQLSQEQRLEELVRMLGGAADDEGAVQHAKGLLKNAQ